MLLLVPFSLGKELLFNLNISLYQRLVHFIGARQEYLHKGTKDREEKLEFSVLGEKAR